MIYLPDVNVWLALTSSRHVHHQVAKSWSESISVDSLAFCRITELGFLRLFTNLAVMGGEILTAADAWSMYDVLRTDRRVIFCEEGVSFSEQWRQLGGGISGGRNAWTDTYLAVLASNLGASVVTFDRGFPNVKGCAVIRLSSNN